MNLLIKVYKMKTLLIILCLIPSMFLDAQVIDWNNFNEKTINNIMFDKLNIYTKTEGGYTIIASNVKSSEIYNLIKRNSGKLSMNEIGIVINDKLPEQFVGVFNSISHKDIQDEIITYEDIVHKCFIEWKSSPSDSFFLIGYGSRVEIDSYYNRKTETLYISALFIM